MDCVLTVFDFKTNEKTVIDFNSLRSCVRVGLAHFDHQDHKITFAFPGAYNALVALKREKFCLGISPFLVVYVSLSNNPIL